MELNKIIQGDSLEILKTFPDNSIDCVITSPPYWGLRDYGVLGQLGLEVTFQEYINKLCDIFDEVKRVLKSEGTCWVNLGDTYGGSSMTGGKKGLNGTPKNLEKHFKVATDTERMNKGAVGGGRMKSGSTSKSLSQIPSRFAIEMADRGWILRNEIIWHKPACMPSSATDRFTVDFEKIFFFVKSKKYWFEQQKESLVESSKKDKRRGKIEYEGKWSNQNGNQTISKVKAFAYLDEGGRNKRAVWVVNPKPFSEAHFATFPEDLIVPMVKAGCPKGGVVLDIFMGAGTTAWVAKKLGRNYLGIELNPEYIKIAENRVRQNLLL